MDTKYYRFNARAFERYCYSPHHCRRHIHSLMEKLTDRIPASVIYDEPTITDSLLDKFSAFNRACNLYEYLINRSMEVSQADLNIARNLIYLTQAVHASELSAFLNDYSTCLSKILSQPFGASQLLDIVKYKPSVGTLSKAIYKLQMDAPVTEPIVGCDVSTFSDLAALMSNIIVYVNDTACLDRLMKQYDMNYAGCLFVLRRVLYDIV